jgi:hypothetical protein
VLNFGAFFLRTGAQHNSRATLNPQRGDLREDDRRAFTRPISSLTSLHQRDPEARSAIPRRKR